MSEILSRERTLNEIYLRIAGDYETEAGVAEPGDLFFIVTHHPYKTLKGEVTGKAWREAIRIRMRSRWYEYLGWDREDWDIWHVAIHLGGRKRRGHKRINPYIIHAVEGKGVQVNHLTPGSFTNEGLEGRTRVEIVRFEGISKEQRKKIVDFAISKLGCSFDYSFHRNARLTYAFGLPNLRHNQNQFTCQQLVIAAYAAAGIYFLHPYGSFPICNIGRLLGHPLGHPKDRVNPRYPYLLDHHIYRDPRFVIKAVVYQDPKTGEIKLETKNLLKYSWNDVLREKYLTNK